MVVTRRELEQRIQEATAQVTDPRAGLFGPRSATWRMAREIPVLAGGGRAALLQLAHPAVAHAIEQHSPTLEDPSGRFYRTFTQVFALLFGDVDTVVNTSRAVFKVHAGIHGPITEGSAAYPAGSRYRANQEEALLWVFATLIDTVVQCFPLLVRPLSQQEIDEYYAQSKLFGALFGIPAPLFPEDWSHFRQYVDDTVASDTLHVTAHARQMAGFLLDSPALAFKPLMAGYRAFTAGLLPTRLAQAYGLPHGKRADAAFWVQTQAIRRGFRRLPPRLRYFPAYIDAKRRMAGRGPDRVGKWLEQVAARNLPQAS